MLCRTFLKFTLRRRKTFSPLRNQQGTALVLALIMLALMSLIGALVLSNSSTEVSISGNYRNSQQAFYAADRAVQYAMTNPTIYDRPISGFPLDLSNGAPADDTPHEAAIAVGTGGGRSGLKDGETNQVNYIGATAPPLGEGYDPIYFQARNYTITVTGEGPGNSAVRIEAQVARIVPK